MLDLCKDSNKEFDIISFGEVMMRLSPSDKERLSTSETFTKRAGGSELNVVTGISQLGLRTGIVTKLPDNELGKFVNNKIRYNGVSDDYIVYDEKPTARLGVYYYETGASPRKPTVVYDRADSTVSNMLPHEIDTSVFSSTRLFHTSGISLGVSDNMRTTTEALIDEFRANNVAISFDINYRAALWSESKARETITKILSKIDILFISEETSRRMFRKTGELRDIMKSYCTDYGVSIVATTQRKVISPSRHDFGSIIYNSITDEYYTEDEYRNIEVIDRIGSGDAYVAGVLFGLLSCNDTKEALEFGNAMSAVKNTIAGDLPSCDYDEIEAIITDHRGDMPKSELNR